MRQVIAPAGIEQRILLIRGRRAMLDSDLAGLYGVTTSQLNRAVRRNVARFPSDFMFRLTLLEARALRFQFGISKPTGRGGRRYLPYAFTEQGVAMLSSVLHSTRAVQVNIAIMRAFVRLRSMVSTHGKLARKLRELEARLDTHDHQIRTVLRVLRDLMEPPEKPKPKIGFRVEEVTT